MVELGKIKAVAQQITEQFDPNKIVLFGSHAEGCADQDSDVDLLVVLPFRGKGCRKAVEILERIRAPFPLDLLVRTPAQVRRRIREGDFFMRDIAERGKVLYEKNLT